MIRNEREYRETLRTRDEQIVGLKEAKERLEKKGLAPADVDYALNPLRSFLLEIEDEISAYERLKDSAPRGKAIKLSSIKALGRGLVEVRIARGCTQRELAERLGVHETQVSRDEKNDYKGVTVDRAARLLDTLHFRLEGCLVPVEAAVGQALQVESIEFQKFQNSIVSKCQLGIDTQGFATTLYSTLRESLNVPLVSEMQYLSNAFVTDPFKRMYQEIGEGLRYLTLQVSLTDQRSLETEDVGSGIGRMVPKGSSSRGGSVVSGKTSPALAA